MQVNDLIVEVRDVNRRRVGQITPRDLDLRAELHDCGVGSWTLRLPAEHPAAAHLRRDGAGILVTARLSRPHWDAPQFRVLFSGPVRSPAVEADLSDPTGILSVSGVTDDILLWNRLVFPDPTAEVEDQGVAYAVYGPAPAEDIMHAIVAENGGYAAKPARKNDIGYSVSLGRGPRVQRSLRFDVVGDALADLATVADLRFRVVQPYGDRTSLEFQVMDVADHTATVRFDLRNGTLASQSVSSAPPSATRVIVAGQGQGEDRTLLECTNTAAVEDETRWGVWGRVEVFKDQRNTDDPEELASAGAKALAEGASAVQAAAVPSDDLSMRYLYDWDLGDLVTVVVAGEERRARISTVSLIAGADGTRVGATFGNLSDASPVKAVERKTAAVERRVSALERNAEGGAAATLSAAPLAADIRLSGVTLPGIYSVGSAELAASIPDAPARLPGILEVMGNVGGAALQRYTTQYGLAFSRMLYPGAAAPTWAPEGVWRADPSIRAAVLSAIRWDMVSGLQAAFPDGTVAGDVRTTTDGTLWRRGDDLLTEWHEPTLQNGWTNYADVYAGARYTRTSAGIVVLTGLIKGAAAGQAIFTLPVGYRPAHRMMFATVAGGGDARIDVHAGGMVRVEWATAGSAALGWVSLSPIMFPAADAAPNEAWKKFTAWHEGFSSYGDGSSWPVASYWQDPLGRVWFRGMATRTAALSIGDVNMCSFPEELRLNHQSHRFACASNPLRGIDIIGTEIRAKGSLTPTFVSLTQCTFVPSGVLPLERYVPLLASADYPGYGAPYPGPHAAVFSDGLVFLEGLMRGSASRVRISTLTREVTPTWADSGRRNAVVFAASSDNGRARVDIGTDLHNVASDLPHAWVASDSVPGPWLSLGGIHFHRAGWGQ